MFGLRADEGVVVKKRRWGDLEVVRKPMRRNESRVTGAAGTAMLVNIKLAGTTIKIEDCGVAGSLGSFGGKAVEDPWKGRR